MSSRPHGRQEYRTGWAGDHQGPEQEQYKLDDVLEAETLLIGRVTYESFAGAWPTYHGVFADRMNGTPKVVAFPSGVRVDTLHPV
jgi:dihydrofolate reductase